MIEEVIPGNKTRFRVLEAIYENPGINLTNLIKKVKASPNLVLDYVNKLSLHHIIREEKSGGRKKVHVRNLKPNFDNEVARTLYSLVELNKKFLFYGKYKKLEPYFPQLSDILEDEEGFVLVYGSHARLAATSDSDLDLLLVGKPGKEKIKRIREAFVTLDTELSLKLESIKRFLKDKDKPLHQTLLKDHVIVYGTPAFIKVLSKIRH